MTTPYHLSLTDVRPELLAFVLLMEKRLRDHDADKRQSWKEMSEQDLAVHLSSKTMLLDTAVRNAYTGRLRHAVDLANFAMMIVDVAGVLPLANTAPPTMIHTPQQCKAAFEWLREQATQADAEPLAGIALDEWHALATAALAPPFVNPDAPKVCCGDFSNCTRMCVPRADHWKRLAESSLQWQPVETAPKDGTLLWLLVEPEDHATEDAPICRTVGSNNLEHVGEDCWQFAGWCWNHDHFTEGTGKVVGWMMPNPAPYPAPPPAWQRDDEQTFCTLLLIGGHNVTQDAIASWSDEQCQQAEQWAMAIHLQASDNDDVEVPRTPDCVRPYLERQHG